MVKLADIPNIVERYEADLAEYSKNLTIKGKTLEMALKEQPTWSAYYGERAVELSTVMKFLEGQIKRVRGKLTAQYNENHSRTLSERVTDKYIDKEDEYLSMYEIYLTIVEIHDKYELILDAFNRRGFALRDLTLALVNEIQGTSL